MECREKEKEERENYAIATPPTKFFEFLVLLGNRKKKKKERVEFMERMKS
jgi:hypothetical protein